MYPDPILDGELRWLRLCERSTEVRISKSWAALAVCLCVGEAKADTIVNSFTLSGAGITASGTLTLTTTGTPGVSQITNITGSFSTTNNGGFSGAITGLNPGSYDASSPTSDTHSVWDNLFYTTSPPSCYSLSGPSTAVLDVCGLDFLVAGGYEVNVFANPYGGAAVYLLSDGKVGAYPYVDDNAPVTFGVTPVPEPAAIPFFAVTMLLIGWMPLGRRLASVVLR